MSRLDRLLRAALLRYVRAAPRGVAPEGPPPVTFVLATAWGMGGTIRTVLTLAGHLARDRPVRIISIGRGVAKPFFDFPEGVEVVSLDDHRANVEPPKRWRRLRKRLKERPSLLADPAEPVGERLSLWTDVRLVRQLRGSRGILMGTRPGLNLMIAELAPPGMVLVGQDHMNLDAYTEDLQAAIWSGYPALDAVVTLTERDRARYAGRIGEAVRVERIPNAARRFAAGRADLDAKVIVAAGRLTRQKGFDLLIGAFEQVLRRHGDWRLDIYGSGREGDNLRELIGIAGLDHAVRLRKPVASFGQVLRRASIYVLSSRFEGFPLVLVEAMSKGLAVLATDCPTGPAEIVEDHVNGLLVPFKDVDALAAGMLELVEDAGLRERCAAAGIETARAYTPEAVGAQWTRLLDELWAGAGQRTSAATRPRRWSKIASRSRATNMRRAAAPNGPNGSA